MGLEVWREITTEYNGRAIKGSFKFVDGRVDVRTLYGSKTAQSGGQVPERIAKDLLANWRVKEELKVSARSLKEKLA